MKQPLFLQRRVLSAHSLQKPYQKPIVFCLLWLVFVLSSCGQEEAVAPPDSLVSEEKMVEALVGTHILEQQVNNLRVPKSEKKDSFDVYQQRIFSRLSIDSSAYYESYEYYIAPSQVKTMHRIMENVADSLSELRNEVTPKRN